MIPYDHSEYPPLVMMDCAVSNPVTSQFKRAKAKFDTGAPLTVIPEQWADQLGLVAHDTVDMGDYKGEVETHPTYFVSLELNGFAFPWIEVMACPRRNVLIARDLLNQLNIFLYGKDLQFEVADHQ